MAVVDNMVIVQGGLGTNPGDALDNLLDVTMIMVEKSFVWKEYMGNNERTEDYTHFEGDGLFNCEIVKEKYGEKVTEAGIFPGVGCWWGRHFETDLPLIKPLFFVVRE